MDIRQWLENTADRAPPDQEVQLDWPASLQPHSEPGQLTRKYRRKRKRASSDSSIIEARHPHHNRVKAADDAHSSDGIVSADRAAARPRSSLSSQRSRSAQREAPVKTYEKRARHKTKPDRYEPKSKKHRKVRDTREDERSRPRRRKSHRSGDGGRTTGLVQSFQLKTGPKNSRLTLRPEATAGLFKHGRASAQITGRGGGLPDLVFNEMKFLQKPKDHQDEQPKDGIEHHTAKKDRKTQHEEEISAYFAAQRPVTNQGLRNDRRRQVAKPAQPQAHQAHAGLREAERRVTDPPVELPEKPFLGFGSKGAHLESQDPHPTSHSYYIWSESAPQQGEPTRARSSIAVGEGQVHSPRPREPRRLAGDDLVSADEIENGPNGSDLDTRDLRRGARRQTRRTRGPAVVEVYQPPLVSTDNDDHRRRSITKTTLQSLPRQAPREPLDQPPKQSNGASQRRKRSISYHTSDILNIRDAHQDTAQKRHRAQDHDRLDDSRAQEQENLNPKSSTPTGKLLRQVREVVERPLQHSRPSVPVLRHIPKAHVDATDESILFQNEGGRVAVVEASNSRTARQLGPYGGLRERRLESAAGLRDEQTSRALHHAAMQTHNVRSRQSNRRPAMPSMAYDEDEMLDDEPDFAPYGYEEHFTYANARDAESLVHNLRSDRSSGLYEAQAEQLEQMPSDASRFQVSASHISATRTPTNALPLRGLSIEREYRSEHSTVAADQTGVGTLDEFAGFWKPHKLY
ncbi:hypothetical protein LTR85_001858 [Meristemomyces frigidus]|nr:hypothetical protein LTR85_001858 [Meristemomyces frigidus]